jgi:mono/diheme cytochrome c family protein
MAAGSHGTVGPNLDQLKPPYARIVTQVENGGAVMPPFKGSLTSKQIHDVAAFVFTSTH